MNQAVLNLFQTPTDVYHHTSLHTLPIAYSEGLSTEECTHLLENTIPVYSKWPDRTVTGNNPDLVDIYRYRAPFKVGYLKPLGLIIENKSVVLHAQLLYGNPDGLASEVFQSLKLMTLTVDKVPGDQNSGRRIVGLSHAILTPRPEVIA